MENLVGKQFGKWTVLSFAELRNKAVYWRVQCECGRVTNAATSHLKRGETTRCGYCGKRRGRVLGTQFPVEYRAYHDAKQRCTNPNKEKWPHYGGRGIEFLFNDFQEFIDVIGPKPDPTYMLDRIDNDGHYAPDNVRWATPSESARNQRKGEIISDML